MTDVLQPDALTLGLPLMRDPARGTLYLVMGDFMFGVGNMNTGHVYAFRQIPIVKGEGANVPVDYPTGWTISVEGLNVQQRAEMIASSFLALNMGLQRSPLPDNAANVGYFLNAVTETHLPAIAKEHANTMTVMMRAAMMAIAAKQGKLSMIELLVELERLIAVVSCLPEDVISRTVSFEDKPKVTTLHLVNPDGSQPGGDA